ncbi:hypothetical protein EAF00_009456 [Botryotinia globosa]|nr:hypothetical protein EAF00_009456 [Botryotinia globosa]
MYTRVLKDLNTHFWNKVTSGILWSGQEFKNARWPRITFVPAVEKGVLSTFVGRSCPYRYPVIRNRCKWDHALTPEVARDKG